MTVLFADVVRSMTLAASVDLERLREIMTDLLERSASVLRRYDGTVEYTGDGVMAIFGAPVALEDHAFRACLAALAIQDETSRLAADVHRTDNVELQLRVGLNSGRVIAGEVGSASLGYRATGEDVGMAQRMEAAAPAGGVMLSESTAELVTHLVTLADPECVYIKGADEPVRARRLLAINPREGWLVRAEARLVGRHAEMAALDAAVGRAVSGDGGVVSMTGPPGIGKSRIAREVAARAGDRGVEVYWAFCESHASDVPFHAVTRLLRAATGVAGLDGEAARQRLRTSMPGANPQDLRLLDDLLGIAEPGLPLSPMHPDVRRRRLTALINTASLFRNRPALYVIEDVHWIDTVSEAMLAEFLAVFAKTASLALITYRPDYQGVLAGMADAVKLVPLSDSDTEALIGELLGSHPSVGELATIVADRAAGNPFFAEEIVRELEQRGVLAGERGDYLCRVDVAEVRVPATVQAAIESRIDRLTAPAKRMLNAASVIGARFDAELIDALDVEPTFEELMTAELVDQVRFTPNPEFAFRHPLIRAVAYESQLKSDRAQWHRQLTAAIEKSGSEANAALIAEHLEGAGDQAEAYCWHMRAATWSTNRDLVAARISWLRACRIADALPADGPDRLAMRIAPRTMLCATDSQARAVGESQVRFDELAELCTAAGDSVSLAIGMSARSTELCFAGRVREAARLSSQQMALLESIGDPTPTMGLAALAFINWLRVGEFGEIHRWSDNIIDLAGGDPVKGAGFGVGSPLAVALAWRGTARWWLGRPDWRRDLHDAVAMAMRSNPDTVGAVTAWSYGFAMHYGVLRADESIVRAGDDALQIARRTNTDRAVDLPTYTMAVALLTQEDVAGHGRGLELMTQVRDIWRDKRAFFLIPVTDIWIAREAARHGDGDAAIEVMRDALDGLRQSGNIFYSVWGTSILVDMLLTRGGHTDLADVHESIDWVAGLGADSAACNITVLRMRALVAQAQSDELTYRDHRDRYRATAKSLGFEGHLAWADAMP